MNYDQEFSHPCLAQFDEIQNDLVHQPVRADRRIDLLLADWHLPYL